MKNSVNFYTLTHSIQRKLNIRFDWGGGNSLKKYLQKMNFGEKGKNLPRN